MPLAVPLQVSSLDPRVQFKQNCITVAVNAHGCMFQSPRALEADLPVGLYVPHTKQFAKARVVSSNPLGESGKLWQIGVELDRARDIWGIDFPPDDWPDRPRDGQEQAHDESPSELASATDPVAPKGSTPAPGPDSAPPPPKPAVLPEREQAQEPSSAPSKSSDGEVPAEASQNAKQTEDVLGEKDKLGRRSLRTRSAIPLFVSSLDPKVRFSGRCLAIVVSAHGCIFQAPKNFEAGNSIRLEVPSTKSIAKARVVRTKSLRPDGKLWEVAVELEKPRNIWGVEISSQGEVRSAQATKEGTGNDLAFELAAAADPTAPQGLTPPSTTASTSSIPTAAEPESAPVLPQAAASISPPDAAPKASVSDKQTQTAQPKSDKKIAENISTSLATEPQVGATPGAEKVIQQTRRIPPEGVKTTPQELEGAGRFRELLAHLREDLEGKASANWERYRRQAEDNRKETEHQLHQQVGKALEEQGRVASEVEANLQTMRKLHDWVERRLEDIGELIRQQVAQECQQLLRPARQEIQQVVDRVRLQGNKESRETVPDMASFNKQFEEIRQARDYVESVVRSLPETVEKKLQEGIEGSLGNIHARIANEFSSQREAQRKQGKELLVDLTHQVGEILQQKFSQEVTRHESAFLDRMRMQLEEAHRVEDQLHQHVSQANAELTQQSEQILARIEMRLEDQHSKLQKELAEELNRPWESLKEERNRLDAYSAEFRREIMQARSWLSKEQLRLKEWIEDALIEASGKIKGRIHMAVEMAQELLEQRVRKLGARLEDEAEGGIQ